jgi:pilus assembly protein CpaB
MARRRGPILVVISLVLALMAAWVANNWLSMRASAKIGPAPDKVVTAAVDMPLGTKIEEDQLAVIEVLPGTAPKGAFHLTSEVVGKVTSTPVLSGEILLAPRLASSGKGSALASVVDKNMRAVTIKVDDMVGTAGFMAPGNRVDVIATGAYNGAVHALTILSNVKVIAVDQTSPQDPSQPAVVHAVTLMVTPADAELLMKGRTAGQLQLTLRNPLDQSDARSKLPSEPEPVRKVVQVTKVVKVAPAPEVTIIRGTDVKHTAQQTAN